MIFDDVKIGDQFREKISGRTLTVTELTEKGFKYDVLPHYHAYPARYGPSLVMNGELFVNNPDVHDYWDNQYERIEKSTGDDSYGVSGKLPPC